MAEDRDRPQPDDDVDAAFARIVSGWDEDGPEEPRLPPAPAPDDAVTEAPSTGRDTSEPVIIPVWRGDTGATVSDLLRDDMSGGAGGEDEEFTPPTPEPLPPMSDRLFWGALGGLVLGPLLLLYLALARPWWSSWATAVAIVLTIIGFACLVMRQPTHRGDDPDRGARV